MSKGSKITFTITLMVTNEPQVREALPQGRAGGVPVRHRRRVFACARSVASELRVDLGGIALEASIQVSVKNVEERAAAGMTGPLRAHDCNWNGKRRRCRAFSLSCRRSFRFTL